jgi:hypothetical protein
MNGIFANYLWTMFWGSVFWIFWIMWFFPRKYKYRCIRVYVWFKDDKHVIWMWIWLILKNISLLDRIWSLWLVRFAHSPPNFIFWLGRLIFSVSINSRPDNIYLLVRRAKARQFQTVILCYVQISSQLFDLRRGNNELFLVPWNKTLKYLNYFLLGFYSEV